MNNTALLALLMAMATATASARAEDLGVVGTTFPIIEVDVRQLFREQLESVDIPRIERERKAAPQRFFDSLAKRSLPTTERTVTRFLDLSFKLESPIQAPVRQADGSWRWEVLHEAGKVINPVAERPTARAMLFFDSSQLDQVEFARQLMAAAGASLKLVEAGQGGVLSAAESLKTHVYYADDRIMGRFQIAELPALLYVHRSNSTKMAVTAFARPFKLADAFGWPQLHRTAQQTPRR